MGLLPDWQIQRDVKIAPFADGSRRPGVISYGVTSYGYDVRVGRRFKVFTNALCAVVDPKNFDPKSFVDIEGDYCLIPPNSFALAETVEYFEIPRDVLACCLGKSTYARCFTADTYVSLSGGKALRLEEMARRSERGEPFLGYTVGPEGRVSSARLEAPRFIDRDALVEVVLDSGKSVRCTPDHPFLAADGRMVPAHELRPGSALLPRNRRPQKVAAIRDVPGIHDVYCLTVPETGNFALDAGVFVHNCGIIVNVTPLEPEWRGKVTIEISNTTPLPAKIYAGEGIAQILFFRADAECRTSYADKKGKYQDQAGLTLPFVLGSDPPKP